jgi:hypothetical protein
MLHKIFKNDVVNRIGYPHVAKIGILGISFKEKRVKE